MHSLKRFRSLLFLVAAFALPRGGTSVAASPYPYCEASCNTTESCETTCWSCDDVCVLVTCGEYHGGGGNGKCIGVCGDAYCNGDNGEDTETCADDCPGYCGDDICVLGEVNYCSADCPGSCEDGVCQPWEANPCLATFCEEDCGTASCPTEPAECQPGAICGEGDLGRCNPNFWCQEVSICNEVGGECVTDSDCCIGEICMLDVWSDPPQPCNLVQNIFYNCAWWIHPNTSHCVEK